MQKLSELISTMKLPVQRKEHFSKHNLMWLIRNIGVKAIQKGRFSFTKKGKLKTKKKEITF